jgi:cyclophilin family peptidyl-prolyl cis-trans isomerase
MSDIQVACGGTVPDGYGDTKPTFARPEQVLDDQAQHEATIATSCGTITVSLLSSESPVTANNFAFLAQQGFYDATLVHRVVPGFVVQMGDPTGTGTGGPGYEFRDELGAARARGYPRGTVAMANAGPDTNGSQFFVCLADVGLPPDYSLVGFTMANGHLPTEGAVVLPGGQVTSSRRSPQLGRVIGMAWVPAAQAQDGAEITISDEGARYEATVTTAPFYDPEGEVLRS